MGDLIEAGQRRRNTPRWLPPLAVVALAVGIGYAVVRPGDGESPATPSATLSAPGVLTPTAPNTRPAGAPWPTEASACGATVDLPLLSVAPLDERTGLRVLVGGAGLRSVDVDSGRTHRLRNTAGRSVGKVTDLERAADGVHALSLRCPIPGQFPIGRVLEVRRSGAARVPGLGQADDLMSAPDRTWALTYNRNPDEPVVLTPLSGGVRMDLPAGFGPFVATSSELLGGLNVEGGTELVAVSRADLTARRLEGETLLAANDSAVITAGQCEAASRCVLTRTISNENRRHYALPPGRYPSSGATISDGGRYLAFQLARPGPDPRFEMGHPGGPSDIAVLDLESGHLTVVPGVELAPKASAGLVFSAGGEWLVITLNEGSRTRLLVWRPGLDRARESPASLPGKVLYNVPVLVTSGWATSRAGGRNRWAVSN